MPKILWGLIFLLGASSALARRPDGCLKEIVREILGKEIRVIFSPDFDSPKRLREEEENFLALLERFESDRDQSFSSQLWGGEPALKFIPPEQVPIVFKYLNWYRYQQHQIQRKLETSDSKRKWVAAVYENVYALQRKIDRLISVIIRSHLRLEASWARRHSLDWEMDEQILLSENILSIQRAINSFDISKSIKFATFARYKITAYAAKLRERENRLKRKPRNGEILGDEEVHSPYENRITRLTHLIPDRHSEFVEAAVELRELFDFIEKNFPKELRNKNEETDFRRFSLVYGLYGKIPVNAREAGEMEKPKVRRQAVEQSCERIRVKLLHFFEKSRFNIEIFRPARR